MALRDEQGKNGRYIGGSVEVSVGGDETDTDGPERKAAGVDPDATFWKCFNSFFGVQYNYTVVSVLEILLKYRYGRIDEWVVSAIDGVVFGGTVVGMICIGYLGDTVGRQKTYLWTLYLAIASTAVCTFSTWGGKSSVEIVLVTIRWFVGLACGGFFPLSAAESFEESGSDATVEGISVLTLGQLAPYVFGMVAALWQGIEHSDAKLDWVFHGLLFMGILPFIAALPYALRLADLEEAGHAPSPAEGAGLATVSDMAKVVAMPQYRGKLLACGTCWFLYDAVGFYIGLYSSSILEQVFTSEDFFNNCLQNVYGNTTCLFAAGLSLLVLRYRLLNSSTFMVVGNFFMGVCFALFGYAWASGVSNTLLFSIFLLCRFSTWVGVPHCVYLIPNEIFPREIRSTCNGLAAAMGKLGAIFGIFVIPNICSTIVGRFALCASLCGLNMVVAAAVLIPTQVLSEAAEADAQQTQTTPLLSDPI